MKTYLIPNTKQYKANLHCHTVHSDGWKTPEVLKKEYMERGYSIIAFTDHEYIVNHQHLNDDNFIAIIFFEICISFSIGIGKIGFFFRFVYDFKERGFCNINITFFNKGWGETVDHC